MSKQSLALWRSEGKGPPFVKLGPSVVRYRRDALREYMLANEKGEN